MSFSWGILSTGRIAEDFANCLQINKCIQFFFSFCFEKKKKITTQILFKKAKIIAVGSRSQQSADEFGKKFDIEHRHAR